ncbi:RNA-binding protein CP33, chloroplastic [Ananas comosus]|uniref:RNA-binding protein CP33, chloroplastic n=1 Tax=Ananas comosus TaxID=4615 RepID=A0A199V5G3_ANACO|nr:RNA-binding protein CP33, chloroplastic [Ananas comosus]
MALPLLRPPPPPSSPFSKTSHTRLISFSFSSSPSSSPQISIAKIWGRGSSTSAATSSSSSTAEATTVTEVDSGENRRRLIAQNIPWNCTAEDIRDLFEKHGAVIDVELSMYNSSKNRGLAFVTMASEEEALAALNNLNSSELDGRIIKVEFARSLKKQPAAPTVPVQKYNVFVGNLSWRVRSRDLQELFSANRNVLSAEVIFQSNPRRSAGYGFVSFASKEEAEAAIATYNGKRFMGRPIRLVLGKLHADDSGKEPDAAEQPEEAPNELSVS